MGSQLVYVRLYRQRSFISNIGEDLAHSPSQNLNTLLPKNTFSFLTNEVSWLKLLFCASWLWPLWLYPVPIPSLFLATRKVALTLAARKEASTWERSLERKEDWTSAARKVDSILEAKCKA